MVAGGIKAGGGRASRRWGISVLGSFGFVVDGDKIGEREDVFFDRDGDAGERVEGEQFGGKVGGEGFDKAAGAAGGAIGGLLGDRGVIDGAGDVVFELAEGAAGGEAEGEVEGLRGGDFLLRHADMAADLESADFDGVRREHGG
jgi:hypothetical protein